MSFKPMRDCLKKSWEAFLRMVPKVVFGLTHIHMHTDTHHTHIPAHTHACIHLKQGYFHHTWWHRLIITALVKWRQEEHQFGIILTYRERDPVSNKKQTCVCMWCIHVYMFLYTHLYVQPHIWGDQCQMFLSAVCLCLF